MQPQAAERSIDFESIYEENVALLISTAVEHFHICDMEAQALAHEVFISYLLKAREIRNARAWLLAAIYNASKQYLRKRNRQNAVAAEFLHVQTSSGNDAVTDELVAREALSCLTARCQLALRLRFVEGYTIPEIAGELHTSAKYAQKLVSRCLQQARDRYAKKART